MGGRGAFVDSDHQNYTFVEDGQTYRTIKKYEGFETIEKINPEQHTAAPYMSHSGENIYVVVYKGKISSIIVYGEDHTQVTSIDFYNEHHGVSPHTHPNGVHQHGKPGIQPTEKEWQLINYIVKKTRLKYYNGKGSN